MATISLSKKIETTADNRYTLKIWVSAASNNIPSQIFLYCHMAPVPSYVPQDIFQRTCSYSDMLNYPYDTPNSESPYFRKSGIYKEYTSFRDAYNFWTTIKTNVQTLIDEIVTTNTAVGTQVVNTYP